ncbi:MAG: hypothetical protein ACN6RK_04705 [Stenotrophomonas sp.]
MTNLLLIGEIHGTNEAPALIGDLACTSAKARKNLIVAPKIPMHEHASINQFLMSVGTNAYQTALLTGRFWAREMQDGRSSRAILKLLHRLRALRAESASVRVLAIDDGMAGERDVNMATSIRAMRSEGTKVIVLLGNVHASRAKEQRSVPEYEPPGYLMKDLALHSEYVGGPTGNAWICAPECGVISIPDNRFMSDRKGHASAEGGKLRVMKEPMEHTAPRLHFQQLIEICAPNPTIKSTTCP